MASVSVGIAKEEQKKICSHYKAKTPNEISTKIKNGALVVSELSRLPAGRAGTREIWKYVRQVCKPVKRQIIAEADSDPQEKEFLVKLEKWCCSVCVELHEQRRLPFPIAVYSNLKAGSFRKHLRKHNIRLNPPHGPGIQQGAAADEDPLRQPLQLTPPSKESNERFKDLGCKWLTVKSRPMVILEDEQLMSILEEVAEEAIRVYKESDGSKKLDVQKYTTSRRTMSREVNKLYDHNAKQ